MLNQRGKPWSPERFVTRPPPTSLLYHISCLEDRFYLSHGTNLPGISGWPWTLYTAEGDSWSVCFHLLIQLLGLQMWATIPAWTTSSWVWRSHLIVIIFSWARLQSDESYHDTPVSVAPLPSLHTLCPLPVSLSPSSPSPSSALLSHIQTAVFMSELSLSFKTKVSCLWCPALCLDFQCCLWVQPQSLILYWQWPNGLALAKRVWCESQCGVSVSVDLQ